MCAAKKAPARKTSTLPANYKEQLAAEAAAIQDRIAAPSGDRVRMQAGRGFTTPDGGEGGTLEVVVVDFISTNLYYDTQYDKDNPAPPACFAIGPEPSMLVPSPNAPDRQAEACGMCPMNQFGSDGRGKACKNTRLVAVTPVVELGEEGAPIWVMSIPPTSIKAFDSYVRDLSAKHQTVPIGMATEVTLDEALTFVAPRFKAIRPLDDDELGMVIGMRETARARLVTEPDVSQSAGKPAAKGATARRRR